MSNAKPMTDERLAELASNRRSLLGAARRELFAEVYRLRHEVKRLDGTSEVHRCAMSKRLRVHLRESGQEVKRLRALLRKLLNHLKGCGRRDLHADMVREIEGVVGGDPPRHGLH